MIERHAIIKNDNEEILILFFNYDYEFTNNSKTNPISIKDNINNYLKTKKLKFIGNKILLAVGGILVATLLITKSNIVFDKFNEDSIKYVSNEIVISSKFPVINKNETISKDKTLIEKKVSKKNVVKENKIIKNEVSNKKTNETKTSINKSQTKETITNTQEKITVYRKSGSVIVLNLEDYVLGVVAAEMPASFNIEALKAQAILARTYALKSKSENKKLSDTVSTQAYIDINQMKKKWGNEYEKYYNKILNAVNSTKNVTIKYNNKYIDAVYHSTSNGYTEDAIEVWGHSISYLKSVDSHWDINAKTYLKAEQKEIDYILKLFEIDNINQIKIVKRDASGRVSEVLVDNQIYSGINIRELLSLRSTDFDIEIIDNFMNITTKGYGHGVGMSQYGANGMAKEGYTCFEIIKHYYQGVKIE